MAKALKPKPDGSYDNPFVISASKMSFGFDGCKKCFHHDVVHGWREPRGPFPSVFQKLDKLTKEAYDGIAWKNDGKIITGGTTLRSKPTEIAPGIFVVFTGRTDCHIEYPNHNISIRDFKTSATMSEHSEKYWRQNRAYYEGFTRPDNGNAPRIVVDIGIIPLVPRSMMFGADHKTMITHFDAFEFILPLEDDRWQKFLTDELAPVLQKEPEGKEGCHMCFLREHGWTPPPKKKKAKVSKEKVSR